MRDQRNALTYAFGTKNARKAAQSVAENALLSNAPAGVATAAESAILSSIPAEAVAEASDKAAALQAQIQANKPVPQANLAATHPSDVYPIDLLVPNGLTTLGQLPIQEWQDAVAAGTAITSTSRFVAHRVEAVVKSSNVTQLQILRFILVLLELIRGLKRGKQSDPHGSKRLPARDDLKRILSAGSSTTAQLPDPVLDAIRRKFAPQGTGLLSKTDLTFLHTTICALSLHIPPVPAHDGGSSSLGGNAANELATDPSDLRDDLRLDPATITQYFRELGCRIDRPREAEFAKWGIKNGKIEAGARRIARLKLPLEFPKISRRGGGARR
jgi:DNA-directed RNA polymerase I subunit RPA49